MDRLHEEFLKEYMANNSFGCGNDYDLVSFFKMFSAFEVHSLKDLQDAPHKYAEFLYKNINLINATSQKDQLPRLIEITRDKLIKRITAATIKPQRDYVEIVSELTPNRSNSHILDVGAGQIPYSAMLFGEKFKHASTMDKEFFLPNETLENMNVTPYDMYFDANTPVDNFDIVVGKAPCTAIEHIVRNCVASGKPYFIELCDCAIPNKTPYFVGWNGWQDVLPDIDEYIKFFTAHTTFAFNLGDATAEQVGKVITKHIPPRKFPTSISVTKISKYITPNSWISDENGSEEQAPNKDDNDFLQMELFERS